MNEPQEGARVDLDWGPTGEVGRNGNLEQPVQVGVRSLTPAELAGIRLTPAELASIRASNADTTLRVWMCGVLALIFVGLNVGVGWMVYSAYLSDLELLKLKLIVAEQRVISEKAFIALIGATVVQVGAGIATIVAYLFPRRSGS